MIDRQISQTEKKHRKGKKISSNIKKLPIITERERDEGREGGSKWVRERDRNREGVRTCLDEFNIPVCTA